MQTAQKHTPEALKDFLVSNMLHYKNGLGNVGQVTLEEASEALSLAPSSVVCQLHLLHAEGFLSLLRIGGRDGEQVFFQVSE